MNRKVQIDDVVTLLVDVPSDFSDAVIPRGTHGTVVECYDQPTEGYAVDLAIPDDSLEGGFRYENVILIPGQFVVQDQTAAPA